MPDPCVELPFAGEIAGERLGTLGDRFPGRLLEEIDLAATTTDVDSVGSEWYFKKSARPEEIFPSPFSPSNGDLVVGFGGLWVTS